MLITFILPSNQHHKNDDDEYFRLPTKGSVYEKFEENQRPVSGKKINDLGMFWKFDKEKKK